MPEAPDLEVIKDFLNENVNGQTIESARVLRPTVVRSIAGDFDSSLEGQTIDLTERQGKFLTIGLSSGHCLVINPMLTGVLQYATVKDRV